MAVDEDVNKAKKESEFATWNSVLEKEQTQDIELIYPPCIICGSTDEPIFLSEAKDYFSYLPGTYGLVECKDKECGVVFTSPRPKDIGCAYKGFYSKSRFGDSVKNEQLGPDKTLLEIVRVHTINRLCEGKMKQNNNEMRLLDVGCSHGNFLLNCSKICPSVRLEGCDMDSGAIADSLAIHVAKLHINDADKPLPQKGSYDIITMLHSLEHMEYPLEALCDARRVLKPGGLLYVEVPNYDSFARRVWGGFWLPLFVPQHLTHFTRKGLKNVILMAGFKEQDIVKQNGILSFKFEIFSCVYLWLWYKFMNMISEAKKAKVNKIRTVNPLSYELIIDGITDPILWAFALTEILVLAFFLVVELFYSICIAQTRYSAHHYIAVRKKMLPE